MLNIKYPAYNFRVKKHENKELIFDEIRRRWVMLTPEEWVRQNFLQYLIQIKNYPKSLCSVEKIIKLGELRKRCDIVVYKNNTPWMIVECKEMNDHLNIKVLEQILRYNMAIPVQYLVVTNGNTSFVYELIGGKINELKALPSI